MIEETDFETYLYLSNNKFEIILFDKKHIKNLFQETITFENDFNFLEFTELTKFLAKIKHDKIFFLIGSNGKLSSIKHEDKSNYLPFIFGKPEIDQFLKFKQKIDDSKFNYKDINNLFFFPSDRWDIQLNNDLLIKLSSKNIKKTLDLISDFLLENDNNTIKIVDARIQNQIILDD